MTKDELNDLYFNWMYQLVYRKRYTKGLSYKKLLLYLNSINFDYIISMDANRWDEGIDLRYRFGYEDNYDMSMISTFLDCRPCSILEMMVALSSQMNRIMTGSDIDYDEAKWFWGMIKNLRLDSMFDSNFDKDYIDERISIFLNREYESNGDGGLFTIEQCEEDLRNVEIWYQMCWYLDSIIYEKER